MAEAEKSEVEVVEALVECEETVDHLKRENTLLREAAGSFGELAERLNATLESERRLVHDRRTQPRGSGDRRQKSPEVEPSHR